MSCGHQSNIWLTMEPGVDGTREKLCIPCYRAALRRAA